MSARITPDLLGLTQLQRIAIALAGRSMAAQIRA
jgi:hypothetical protein